MVHNTWWRLILIVNNITSKYAYNDLKLHLLHFVQLLWEIYDWVALQKFAPSAQKLNWVPGPVPSLVVFTLAFHAILCDKYKHVLRRQGASTRCDKFRLLFPKKEKDPAVASSLESVPIWFDPTSLAIIPIPFGATLLGGFQIPGW